MITSEGRELPKLLIKGPAEFYERYHPLGGLESAAGVKCLRWRACWCLEGVNKPRHLGCLQETGNNPWVFLCDGPISANAFYPCS